jgi:hypothetical protein
MEKSKAPKAEKPTLVTVRLLKPHTHEGVDLQPGAILEVWSDQARWLVSMQAAEVLNDRE